MSLRVLIADDNPDFCRYLKGIIEAVPDFTVVAMASNGKEAIILSQAYQPQVVFLDIEMPEINGVEAARELAKTQPDICFVFCTAYPDYALQAFELYSFDYILKPINEMRVKKTLERLMAKINGEQLSGNHSALGILFDTDNRQVYINSNEIMYIENSKPKVIIKTEKQIYLARGTLHSLEIRLNPYGFFRCHRGYLVNLTKVEALVPFGHTFQICLQSGDTVLLSRKREKILRDKLKI
ncbi:MAG: DNA-binding response regulator [Firmicutes bacterium HGW-Firmicutes-15]|nr:MAG: DNA-binding response regulator [Firmicutes bacterium HGW-Firmicutes-15]